MSDLFTFPLVTAVFLAGIGSVAAVDTYDRLRDDKDDPRAILSITCAGFCYLLAAAFLQIGLTK